MIVRVELVVGDPPSTTGEECPVCGFDAVLEFPVHLLTAAGVSPWGAIKACVRCFEEKRRTQ